MLLRTIRTAILGTGLLLTGAAAMAAEPLIEASALEKMAKAADSPAEHAKVAKHYRLRAESFEVKAAEHEGRVKKLKSTHNPLAIKWPAMAPWQRDVQLAMQARRAASENLALADRHYRLAVETELAE